MTPTIWCEHSASYLHIYIYIYHMCMRGWVRAWGVCVCVCSFVVVNDNVE